MSCVTARPDRTESDDLAVRGLCETHAMQFAASVAKRFGTHTESHEGVARERTTPVGVEEFTEYAAMLELQERCDDCPIIVDDGHVKPSPSWRWERLGTECRADARTAAYAKYPNFLPFLSWDLKMLDLPAVRITRQADGLLYEALRSIIQSWPTCEGCPVPEAPKRKEAEGLKSSILGALADHGTMGRTDLIAVVKKLINNNFASIMGPLVAEGLVVCTSKGPAKFYSLPEKSA